MEMQELEIQVDTDGNVTVHIKGVKGQDCLLITRSIEEALGNVAERSVTHEYYEEPMKDYIPCKISES